VEEKLDLSKPTTAEVVRTLNMTKPETSGPRTASTSTIGTAKQSAEQQWSATAKTDDKTASKSTKDANKDEVLNRR